MAVLLSFVHYVAKPVGAAFPVGKTVRSVVLMMSVLALQVPQLSCWAHPTELARFDEMAMMHMKSAFAAAKAMSSPDNLVAVPVKRLLVEIAVPVHGDRSLLLTIAVMVIPSRCLLVEPVASAQDDLFFVVLAEKGTTSLEILLVVAVVHTSWSGLRKSVEEFFGKGDLHSKVHVAFAVGLVG